MVDNTNLIKVLNSKNKFCPLCATKHIVSTIVIREEIQSIRQSNLSYIACYEYCDNTNDLFIEDWQLHANAARYKESLLNSK